MSVEQAIVLALIQGITEFLPISSSGHLVLGSWLFGWPDQGLVFDAAVHLGTLAAVLVYFRATWTALARCILTGGRVNNNIGGDGPASITAGRLIALMVIGTIPIVIGGVLLKSTLENSLRTPEAVGFLLLGTSALLAAAEMFGRRTRRLAETTPADSAFIGLAQVVALLPGISRSGTTMAAGMLSNMTRDAAARFSFLLAVPAIAGAGLFLMVDAATDGEFDGARWGLLALAAAISFVTGLAAIAGLMRLLRNWSFKPFILYALAAGTAVLVARALGA